MGQKQTHPTQLQLSLSPLIPPPLPEAVRLQVLCLLATMIHKSATAIWTETAKASEEKCDERQD